MSTEPVSRSGMETDMIDACSPTLRSDQFTLVAVVIRGDRISSGKGVVQPVPVIERLRW